MNIFIPKLFCERVNETQILRFVYGNKYYENWIVLWIRKMQYITKSKKTFNSIWLSTWSYNVTKEIKSKYSNQNYWHAIRDNLDG